MHRHPYHPHRIIKLFFWIGFLHVVQLHSQILISPHISSTGKVIPLIQPNTAADIYHMPFFTYSDYIRLHCGDSIQANDFFEGACLDVFDFTSSILNDRRFMKWANNPDPLSIQELDVSGLDERWHQVKPYTWTYSSSLGITNDYTKQQTWVADEKKRLKKITRWYSNDKPEIVLDYFYNQYGLLERISTTHHDIRNQQAQTSHQLWFLNEKQQTKMQVTYLGKYKEFSDQELQAYARQIENAIKSGKHTRLAADGLIDIETVLIYNYGLNGPEQVNYYAKYGLNEDTPVFVSDSLYFDAKGRITRYVSGRSGYTDRPHWVELLYEYDKHSSGVKQLTYHRYQERVKELLIDNKTIQYFTYDAKGRISSEIEQQFHPESPFVDGKYIEAEGALLGENKYHFTYTYQGD